MPADPSQVLSSKRIWLDAAGTQVAPGTPGASMWLINTYGNGEVWTSQLLPDNQWGDMIYVKTDAQLASRFDAIGKDEAAAAKQPSATSQWSIQTKPDGTKVRVNELTGETAPLEGFAPTPTKPNTDIWPDPQDGSQWLIDENTGEKIKQISPAVPGWTPGLGVRWPPQAPQTSAGEWARIGLDQNAQNFEQNTKWPALQEQWNKTYAQDTQKLADQVAQWRAQNEQARMATAANLANSWGDQLLRGVPYAVDPSWTTYPGFEQNGPVAQLWKMGGATGYSPPVIPKVQFDPLAAWRAAQAAIKQRQ